MDPNKFRMFECSECGNLQVGWYGYLTRCCLGFPVDAGINLDKFDPKQLSTPTSSTNGSSALTNSYSSGRVERPSGSGSSMPMMADAVRGKDEDCTGQNHKLKRSYSQERNATWDHQEACQSEHLRSVGRACGKEGVQYDVIRAPPNRMPLVNLKR